MRRGFTLIELLIVIGILAILATIVILILNPAQILAQARDSQRLSDLGSLKHAITLYQLTSTSSIVFISPSTTATITPGTTAPPCPFVTTCNGPSAGPYLITSTAVCGTSPGCTGGPGWVPIALTQTSGGSSMPNLPLDPLNKFAYDVNNPYYYGYIGDNSQKTFKVIGRLESSKYAPMMVQDGGNLNQCTTSGSGAYKDNTCWYESFTGQSL